jgi:hypothetical protein
VKGEILELSWIYKENDSQEHRILVSKRGLSLLPGYWPPEIHSDQLLLVF